MKFTPEHTQISDTVRKFVANEINPFTAEREKAGIFPAHELFKKMGDLGLLGIKYPTEFGGMGLEGAVRLGYRNELAAIDSALNASLSSQRSQKQLAQQQLATNLAAQSQAGVLSLAESGLSQSASVSRSYPRAAAVTFVLVAGAAVWAMTRMRTGPGAPRRRRRRFGGKRGGASFSSAPAPFPSQPAYSGQESS